MPVEEFTRFGDIPRNYIEACETNNQNIFLSPEWFELLEAHILSTGQACHYLCFLNDKEQIEAIFPLLSNESEPGILYSFANFYSLDFDIILARPIHQMTKIHGEIAEYLSRREDWKEVRLFPVNAESLSMVLFQEALLDKGLYHYLDFCHHNWIFLNNRRLSLKDFIAEKGSRVKNMLRLERKLFREDNVEIKLVHENHEELEQLIQDYNHVYDRSWKEDENFPDFIPDMIRLCARKDILRLGILYLDNKPVATQFNIHHDQNTLIYKLCYDEDYKAKSVGAVLSVNMMRHALEEDKACLIDYGCGNDTYKKEWMSHRQNRHTFIILNNSTKGKISRVIHKLKNVRNVLLSSQST